MLEGVRAWLGIVVVVAAACGRPGSPAPRTDPPDHVTPDEASADVRSGAAPHAGDPAGDAPGDPGAAPHAGDPAEPAPPRAECNFERRERCVPEFPTTAAYQAAFPACPLTLPRDPPDWMFPNAVSQFSARKTRAARATAPHVCCYVDFVTRQCR
jgi:hypothetical protein